MNTFIKSIMRHSIIKKSFSDSFRAKDLKIIKADKLIELPDFDKPLQFGLYHTDYMLEIDHKNGKWDTPIISPYHNLSIDPRNSSLHYAIQLFEGMKAFKNQNKLLIFRPEKNMERLNNSATRVCLPNFDGEELIKCIETLIKLDKNWIPTKRGYSLYIRPTFISMTNLLGVLPPNSSKLFVILSPAGPYFSTGFNPINIICSEGVNRSWEGGFGYAKLGANYGPTLQYYTEITKKGYQQVLWLYNEIVTEVGVMNFFVYWINENGEKELITCPLDGLILPGVMRDSVISLTKDWGIKVTERHYSIHEVIKALEENRLIEAFGTGTAAVICPIKNISYKGKDYDLKLKGNIGQLGEKIYNTIIDIQLGNVEHKWTRVIT